MKKIKAFVKLVLKAGKATAGPPVGSSLGQHGVNIAAFCKEYNAKTLEHIGLIIPVKVTIYDDKSYAFVLKSPPTASLLLSYANLKNGSSTPNSKKVGFIFYRDIEKIAKIKLNDLNTDNIDKAISIIEGTAKNMGIDIEK